MISSVGIFIITFLQVKGAHILDTWVGNKLKCPHCVLCFTDWLTIAYENSIGVYFGFLMCNLNILWWNSPWIKKKKMKGVIKFLCVCLTELYLNLGKENTSGAGYQYWTRWLLRLLRSWHFNFQREKPANCTSIILTSSFLVILL